MRSTGAPNAIAVVALLLVVVASSGCLAGSATSSSPPSAPRPSSAATPWDMEVTNLQGDGTRSLDSALRLMAMAFGPIPGVDATTAAPGTVDSASPAVRVVRGSLGDLTDAQREAVEEHLRVADDSRTLEISRVDASFVPPARVETPLGGGLLGQVDLAGGFLAAGYPYTDFEREVVEDALRVRTQAAKYFGDVPVLRIRLANDPGEPYVTFFNPTLGEGGVDACDVIVNLATANVDRFKTRRAVSLDVVHCFQSYALGSEAGFLGQVPAWAWEGPAEYILLEEWPPTDADGLAWLVYLTTPDDSLFERSYDAIGYYAQAATAGVDLSQAFRAVLTDVDNPERFALAGTAASPFLDGWASGLAQAEWGGAWTFFGPGLPSGAVQAPSDPIAVQNGSNEAVAQEAYTNHLYVVDSSADLVRVDVNGRARISDGTVDAIVQASAVFCSTDKGCGPCPNGDPPPFKATRLAPDSLLAVSGGTDGTSAVISGHALEEFCEEPPSPSDEFCGRWRSYLDWAREEDAAGHELDRPLAAAIVMQFQGMRPVAPPDLVRHVDAVIHTYRTFAEAPETPLPLQVPVSGRGAEEMYAALLAIDKHCGTGAIPSPP